MLRRLRGGKRSVRTGYSDVTDDVVYLNDEHKQQSNRPHYTTASPPRRQANYSPSVQKKAPPSLSPLKSSPRPEHYRRRLDRLAQTHQSPQQRHNSPDDVVSSGITSLTYESSVTGTSNDNNIEYIFPSTSFTSIASPAAVQSGNNNSVSFSTLWEKEEFDFEHSSNVDSTPLAVSDAQSSTLHIGRGRQDRTSNNRTQRNATHKSNNPVKQRSTTTRTTESMMTSARYTTSQPPPKRLHDHDYRPAPPQQRRATNALNSSKGGDTIIKVTLPSPEREKKEGSPPHSFIASSAQTPKLNNGTNHLINRLLKKHQYQSERPTGSVKKTSMEPLQQADFPSAAARKHPTEVANRRFLRQQKPDPASKSIAVAARRDRPPDPPPDPPAEEWKRPIPVKKVTSTLTKNTATSSNLWEEVENFPAERALQQFFTEHLVTVKKEPVDLESSPRKKEPQTQAAAAVPHRMSEPPQDETDSYSNAFSLDLAVDKQGRFDDGDISALEMFDSATVYLQNAMAVETGNANTKNYWKLKYERLKEETKAAMEHNKIAEESSDIIEQQRDLRHEPEPRNEFDRLFSGLTVDADNSAEFPTICRDGLSQTMNMLMHKVDKLERSGFGAMQIDRHSEVDNTCTPMQTDRLIEDNACAAIAEQAIFPVATLQQHQMEEQPRYEQNLTNNKCLADDLTAGAASRPSIEGHVIESEAADAQRSTPRSGLNERATTSIPGRKQDQNAPRPTHSEKYRRQELNVITPDKLAGSPDSRQPHSASAAKDEVTHPMICLGSLHVEATASARVRQSLLNCSDSLMSCFPSSPSSNQLAIPNGIDPQKLILLCQNPQFLRKTISQTIVNYGKKVMQKREVVSELNQNILRFGARHPLVGESHLKVGLLHMYDGQYADAILHLEEALKIKAAFLGPNHPDFSSILMFIALAQLALERFDDCMTSLLGVRRIREDAVGHTHPEIGLILNNIACVHYELGDFKRAEELFQEALDLQREAFTTEPTFLKSVSTLLSNIAFLHAKNGLFRKALIELEGALQIQQEILCDENNASDAITENIAHIMAIQKMQHGSGNMEEITNQYILMLKRR